MRSVRVNEPRRCPDVLLDWLPRKATLADDEIGLLPDVLRAVVRHSGERKGLAPERVSETLGAVAELEPQYREAMANPDTAGPSKQLFQQMQREGVDVTDPAALTAWIEAFNERPQEERDAILGNSLDALAGRVNRGQLH